MTLLLLLLLLLHLKNTKPLHIVAGMQCNGTVLQLSNIKCNAAQSREKLSVVL
jgi:hypothetical protein